jgi:hypothetical protein
MLAEIPYVKWRCSSTEANRERSPARLGDSPNRRRIVWYKHSPRMLSGHDQSEAQETTEIMIPIPCENSS